VFPCVCGSILFEPQLFSSHSSSSSLANFLSISSFPLHARYRFSSSSSTYPHTGMLSDSFPRSPKIPAGIFSPPFFLLRNISTFVDILRRAVWLCRFRTRARSINKTASLPLNFLDLSKSSAPPVFRCRKQVGRKPYTASRSSPMTASRILPLPPERTPCGTPLPPAGPRRGCVMCRMKAHLFALGGMPR